MTICGNYCKNENYQVNEEIEMKKLLRFIFTLALFIVCGCDEFSKPEIYPEKKIYVSDLDYLIRRAPIFAIAKRLQLLHGRNRIFSAGIY